MAAKFKVDLANSFPNWSDDVGAWATTTGGGTIAPHPTAADSANFDGNSGNCIVDVSSACSNLLCTGAYIGTISGSADLSVGAGAVNQFLLVAGMTWSYTGALTFAPTGAGRKITSGGKTLANFTLNATTGTNGSTMQDACTVSGTVTVTQGVLSTGTNFALVCGSLSSSNTNTRSLTLNTSTVTLTGTGTVWDTSTTTGLTLSAASSTIVISDTTRGAKTFRGGGLTYGNLSITGAGATTTFTGTNTFGTFTSGAIVLAFSDPQTATTWVLSAGCFSITGNIVCTSGTVTAPAGCTITNSAASGGATFDATAATDGGGNSGWNFGSAAAPVPSRAVIAMSMRM